MYLFLWQLLLMAARLSLASRLGTSSWSNTFPKSTVVQLPSGGWAGLSGLIEEHEIQACRRCSRSQTAIPEMSAGSMLMRQPA